MHDLNYIRKYLTYLKTITIRDGGYYAIDVTNSHNFKNHNELHSAAAKAGVVKKGRPCRYTKKQVRTNDVIKVHDYYVKSQEQKKLDRIQRLLDEAPEQPKLDLPEPGDKVIDFADEQEIRSKRFKELSKQLKKLEGFYWFLLAAQKNMHTLFEHFGLMDQYVTHAELQRASEERKNAKA